ERFKARFALHRIHPYRLRVLLFNTARRFLGDRRLRLALVQGINRPQILRGVRGHLGRLLSAPIWPLSPWYDRTLHPRSFDRKAAERWLDRAGWRGGRGGKRWRVDRPLKLRLLRARGETPRRVAEMVTKDLAAIGVEVGIDVADFAFFRTLLRRGHFDLAVLGLALGRDDDLMAYVHSKGRMNHGHFKNPAIDTMLDALAKTAVGTDRTRDGRSLHRLLFEDPPMVVLYEPIELMVVNRRVLGLSDDGRWPDLATLRLKEVAP
ncbi:MAG: hypothetical protein KAI47_10175, partial [Deltaproteobacteria bacterium]|nr:hypothetical protein [Deltaproteobacteria bacterium]